MACFIKSNRVTQEIITFFFKSQIGSWFGKGDFGKSNSTIRKIIGKTNHVLFLKSNSVFVWKGSTCMPRVLVATTGNGSVSRKWVGDFWWVPHSFFSIIVTCIWWKGKSIMWKIIDKPNLNHGLFFGKSNHVIRGIIAKLNHAFLFWKVKSHQRIAKTNLNHDLFF
jgi:hypothetical protein